MSRRDSDSGHNSNRKRRYSDEYEHSKSDRHKQKEDAPKLYSIHQGQVSRIQPYGVFVRITGFRKQGLVHKSQMSNGKVEKPEEMVDEGESVYCKVISLDDDKLGLSMKVVNQRTGEDLDKNHVQSSLDAQMRRTGHKRENKAITLEAVLNTTCRKCGGKGHLAGDCYSAGTGNQYELLPDVDYMVEQEAGASEPKHKKKKKEKKSKKHKRKHDDSSDDESPKKKKSKKHKKEKHRSSSSSDDSSSDSESDHERRHKKKKKKHKSIH